METTKVKFKPEIRQSETYFIYKYNNHYILWSIFKYIMCFACTTTTKFMKLKFSTCFTIQAEQYNFMKMNTFRTRSVTQTDKYLAIFPTIIHFPLPEARDFLVFFFPGVLSGGLKTTSRSHINTCSLGSRDMKPTPSLTRDWRKLSLISPTETDSTAPCTY